MRLSGSVVFASRPVCYAVECFFHVLCPVSTQVNGSAMDLTSDYLVVVYVRVAVGVLY